MSLLRSAVGCGAKNQRPGSVMDQSLRQRNTDSHVCVAETWRRC
ncbi:hypothetical protein OOU_Y34scaffold01007g4 [Pyricularia oryzae Y34]|uniref:Uncharacterized protein n=2 Tax=Pyricularia oryzae TaxID=318829 RepID=A0AA97NMN6_PYRO3|nr:hypothetical protein OOU_Y34scaffold01007g4 [Pyricularia oryzae Y34]